MEPTDPRNLARIRGLLAPFCAYIDAAHANALAMTAAHDAISAYHDHQDPETARALASAIRSLAISSAKANLTGEYAQTLSSAIVWPDAE